MYPSSAAQSDWLRAYYFARAAFSALWVVPAVFLADRAPVAAALLVAYPAWDALANHVDARASGGWAANRSQALNVVTSLIMTIVVVVALTQSMQAVLFAFGVWATLSGLLQLYTGVRRWRSQGAQWVMILSGAQSMLAGGFMVHRAGGALVPSITDVAPYAGFGAFYFLVSALWLTVSAFRKAGADA